MKKVVEPLLKIATLQATYALYGNIIKVAKVKHVLLEPEARPEDRNKHLLEVTDYITHICKTLGEESHLVKRALAAGKQEAEDVYAELQAAGREPKHWTAPEYLRHAIPQMQLVHLIGALENEREITIPGAMAADCQVLKTLTKAKSN